MPEALLKKSDKNITPGLKSENTVVDLTPKTLLYPYNMPPSNEYVMEKLAGIVHTRYSLIFCC
jgi:hypothetical protein